MIPIQSDADRIAESMKRLRLRRLECETTEPLTPPPNTVPPVDSADSDSHDSQNIYASDNDRESDPGPLTTSGSTSVNTPPSAAFVPQTDHRYPLQQHPVVHPDLPYEPRTLPPIAHAAATDSDNATPTLAFIAAHTHVLTTAAAVPLPVKPIASKAVPKPRAKKGAKAAATADMDTQVPSGSEQTVGKRVMRSRAAKNRA